jgi:hypothetical protein
MLLCGLTQKVKAFADLSYFGFLRSELNALRFQEVLVVPILELKAEGKCPVETIHREVKYLNNLIEADHGKLKRLIKPTLGFKSMKTAYATLKYQGNWWIGYGSEWMGYFPGSLWDGKYTQSGSLEWFGEVAAPSVNLMHYVNTSGGYVDASIGRGNVTDPSIYDLGSVASSSFHYGGPGGC